MRWPRTSSRASAIGSRAAPLDRHLPGIIPTLPLGPPQPSDESVNSIRCPAGLCWNSNDKGCRADCPRDAKECCAVQPECGAHKKMHGRTCAMHCPNGFDPMFGNHYTANYTGYVYPTCPVDSAGGKA